MCRNSSITRSRQNRESTSETRLPAACPALLISTRPEAAPHLTTRRILDTNLSNPYLCKHDRRRRTQKLQGLWPGVHCRCAVQCHKGAGSRRLRYRVVCPLQFKLSEAQLTNSTPVQHKQVTIRKSRSPSRKSPMSSASRSWPSAPSVRSSYCNTSEATAMSVPSTRVASLCSARADP